jgi:hypothetical protein
VATLLQREHLREMMGYLLAHKAQVHYPPHDERTHRASEIQNETELRHAVVAGHFVYDCSQTAEILCVCAGLHWPRSMVNGYTGTMLAHLPHYYSARSAGVGALVVFGVGDLAREHVCMVRHPGSDPVLFSHGQERGPFLIPLSVEKRYHPAPYTFLSVAHL